LLAVSRIAKAQLLAALAYRWKRPAMPSSYIVGASQCRLDGLSEGKASRDVHIMIENDRWVGAEH
jgi:hypothetical protein